MKRKALVITALLVVLIVVGIFAALNVPAAPMGVGETISAVSDDVTASDPHWLTPQQQQQGIEALQELMQKNQ